jgi:hypothetical protein
MTSVETTHEDLHSENCQNRRDSYRSGKLRLYAGLSLPFDQFVGRGRLLIDPSSICVL